MNRSEVERALLFRRAQCQHYQQSYFDKIQNFCQLTMPHVERMTLEKSDEVFSSINRNNSNLLVNEQERRIESVDLVNLLADAIAWLGVHHFIFIDEDWKYCGGVTPLTGYSVNPAFRFLDKIMNDIVLISGDCQRMFSLDYWEYGAKKYVSILQCER